MKILEITGQPCSGKTSYLSEKANIGLREIVYKQNFIYKNFDFLVGLKYLGFIKCKRLLGWALEEKVSFLFQLNIFRNAISKFGVFKRIRKSNLTEFKTTIVDEGLSHLPFLFYQTETREVVKFIEEELRCIQVLFLQSTSREEIKLRLKNRGHKRLAFFSIDELIERNHKIELDLIQIYPSSCAELKFIENVENILSLISRSYI